MNGHVTPWLEAYHDGELRGRRLRQVENHLPHCAACRAELDALRALTSLLQAPLPAKGRLPPQRFVSQVELRLSRRPVDPAWKRALEAGWRSIPAGLLTAWAFVHTLFFVSGVALRAARLSALGNLLPGLLPASRPGPSLLEILASPLASPGDVARFLLRLLGHGGPLGWPATLNFVSLAVIGLLYWGWLAGWWARRRHKMIPGR